MNCIIIHGRLTADPELRQTQSGIAVANFTVAVDRKFSKEEKQADFFNCTAWKGVGEVISKHFQKGKEILIKGRMESRKYQDKSGNDRIAWDIVVDDFDFCGSKSDSVTGGGNYSAPAPTLSVGFEEVVDDDVLPF